MIVYKPPCVWYFGYHDQNRLRPLTEKKEMEKEKSKVVTLFCILNNIAPVCQHLHQHLLFDFLIIAILVFCEVVFHGGFI